MVAYILKFILCSGFLYSFYKVFLERESMYKINRFYLLLSLIFSLIAPFYKMELPITMEETNLSPELLAYLLANPQVLEQESGWNYGEIFNIFYGIIGVGLFIRFALNILIISYRIKQDEKFKMDEITYVLDQKTDQPFSFLNYIFLPQENYEDIHPNLIQHEKAHCIQRHSWDIVFIELFQIIFWFNPFIYLYKKSIKLNHEFLADEYVLQNDVDVKTYQHQILYCIATQSQNSVASHFNFILTKKRLLMMTKQTSKRKVRILSFATLPFLLSAFVLFSQKSFAQEVDQSAKSIEKVLDKKVDNPIKEVINLESSISDTIKTKKFRISNNNFTLTDKDLDNINPKDIKTINIKDQNNAIITLKSGETKEIKLNESSEKKHITSNKFSISNSGQLKDIDPKDIKAVFVEKDRNGIKVIKHNNDTIKLHVKSEFKESESRILKLEDLKNNRLLTENVKDQLKQLNIKEFKDFEIFEKGGVTKIKIDGKDFSFPTGIFEVKELTEDHKKLLKEAEEKIKISKIEIDKLKDNPWKITTGQPYTVSSFYIETEPQTKEQISKELDQLKSKEKETKKRIKELEKQQKKLK